VQLEDNFENNCEVKLSLSFSRRKISKKTFKSLSEYRYIRKNTQSLYNVFTESFNARKSKRFDVTPIKSAGSIFLKLFLIVSLRLQDYDYLFFCLFSKTPSDNLGDAVQFLREFDREAAEMCNR
jgi:hypothetical protein